jgi:hypothetical protein
LAEHRRCPLVAASILAVCGEQNGKRWTLWLEERITIDEKLFIRLEVKSIASCRNLQIARTHNELAKSVYDEFIRTAAEAKVERERMKALRTQSHGFDLPVRRMMALVPNPSAVASTISARHAHLRRLLRSATISSSRARSIGLR